MSSSSKNAISILKEYHDRLKNKCGMSEPAYIFSLEKPGVFKCTCNYQDFMTEGCGTSKSTARIGAATLMLSKLSCREPLAAAAVKTHNQRTVESSAPQDYSKTSPNSSRTSSPHAVQLARDFFDRNSSKGNSQIVNYPPKPEDLQLCFSDLNFGMKLPTAPKSETLRKGLDQGMNPITCFEQVMKEMELKFVVEQAEVDSKLVGTAFVVLLKIDLCCMVIGGYGHSLTEAIEKACRNGLDTFRLYMK